MNKTPFIYGTIVSKNAFTNREDETLKLYTNLTNGINTMIISPRRWGKSSLVEKVINEINLNEKKTKTVIIDLFSISSEEEFLELFAKEVIKTSSSKWEDWMSSGKDFFKQLIPKLSLGIDPTTDFSVSFDWKEISKHQDEILNLPEVIAQKKGIQLIICLDEFQNLSIFPNFENFEKKMRASWQRQKNVTYCLYGSKRHMMTDIFNNQSKPFYRFGDIMLLPKIKKEKWISFICNGFKNSGKSIKATDAMLIPLLMKNHSWYVQQLAHYTWTKTKTNAKKEDIINGLNELIQANSPLYQKEIESISTTQLNFLKAIAKRETQLTSIRVMQDYKLGTPRNVIKNKNIMINNDLIQKNNNLFEFVDPAFELWFNKQFFNQPFIKISKFPTHC